MDYGSPWTQLGEWNLQGCGQVSSVGLVLDPIDVAGVFGMIISLFWEKKKKS